MREKKKAAPADDVGPSWEALHHAWMKIGADVAGLDWGAFTNAVHYAPTAKAALAGEYPPLPASYVGGTLLSAEPGITGCKVVLRFSNTDEAEVWFGALATRRAAPVAQGDAEDAARERCLEIAKAAKEVECPICSLSVISNCDSHHGCPMPDIYATAHAKKGGA